MISTGSAIAFALLAAIAGIIVGWLTAEHRQDHTEPMGQAWGEIDHAATDAYMAAHHAARPPRDWPQLYVVWDQCGRPALLDEAGMRRLCGVDGATILEALGR